SRSAQRPRHRVPAHGRTRIDAQRAYSSRTKSDSLSVFDRAKSRRSRRQPDSGASVLRSGDESLGGVRTSQNREMARRRKSEGSKRVIAAIYARKSTDQNGVGDEEKSVTRQIEHAKAYAVKKGWTTIDGYVYVDDGISGAEFVKRPGFI